MIWSSSAIIGSFEAEVGLMITRQISYLDLRSRYRKNSLIVLGLVTAEALLSLVFLKPSRPKKVEILADIGASRFGFD
jgi:hypothetical protein